MRHSSVLILMALVAAPAIADQVYRYRDANGAVYYSDTTPPLDARDTERKRMGDRPNDPSIPYALQIARRNFPVALFVADGCGSGCAQADTYLAKRGVPYVERNVGDEEARTALMAATTGKAEVPVLTVGKSVLRGFDEAAWSTALDAAGYPRSSMLPSGVSAKQQDKTVKAARAASKNSESAPNVESSPAQAN